MNYKKFVFEDLHVLAEVAWYGATENHEPVTKEWHVMLHVVPSAPALRQFEALCKAKQRLEADALFRGAKPLFQRWFLSDIANQESMVNVNVNVSVIGQPPLDGSKMAVWMYYNEVGADHNGYEHLMWADSGTQTTTLLTSYADYLQRHGLTMADDCVRTWFFVRDIDINYAALVKARREFFQKIGLTPATHYIASTGIGGTPGKDGALVQMEAYAVKGLESGQQQYLYGKSHLNATNEYGVTFERGTKVIYGDRSQVFISGTASINNKGEVMHEGDIEKQTLRMWENVETLLAEAGGSFHDVAQMIVYLRDVADYTTVAQRFRERFPNIPCVITLAPVCRPAWLIEMECIAILPQGKANYKAF